jgi:Tfp pilus assembly protein PilV
MVPAVSALIRNRSGAYLIELLVSVVIFVMVISSLSLLMTKISHGTVINRIQSIGNNLAATKIQDFQSRPYALVDTTYNTPGLGQGNGPWFTTNPSPPALPTDQDTCDCSTAAFAALTSSDVVSVDGNSFSRYWCISSIQSTAGLWHSYCSPASDQFKNIRVWVVSNISISTITAEANITRF